MLTMEEVEGITPLPRAIMHSLAAQRIAAGNPKITAEVYDIQHFGELRSRYDVMSVPCLIINDHQVSFGKKNIRQILELLE